MLTIVLLLIVTLAEATIDVFVKLTDGAIPIYTLNFYGLAFAALFLLATLPFLGSNGLRFPKDNLRDTLLIGALIAAQISVFNYAMTKAPIANVVIFWSVAPFFVFIFSALFLNERPRLTHVFIFLIAIAGIITAKPLASGHMVGNLIALGDGAIYAAMVTYMRHEGKTETSNDILWFIAIGALYLSPSLFIFGPGAVTEMVRYEAIGVSLPVGLWAVALGVVSTGLAYLCISIVLKTLNANVYSLVDIIVSPLVASLLGYLVFGEVPPENMIYGGALLLGSGFWLSWMMSRTEPSRAAHPCQCGPAAHHALQASS